MNKELIDLAWPVLQKEFKEYIMKVYKAALECSRVDAHFLENIFGRHNLTSDAEGEDMLTVSRKRVQEMYAHYDAISSDPDRPKDYIESIYEYADGVTIALDDLFGSKCLPDENSSKVERLEKNEKVDSSEPKFCKGDVVIYKRTGKKKVVLDIDKYGRYLIALPNMQSPMYVDEFNLELYAEHKETDEIIDNPFEKRTPLSPEVEEIIDKISTEIVEILTQPIKEYFEKLDKK